jgi:hypothetical protein
MREKTTSNFVLAVSQAGLVVPAIFAQKLKTVLSKEDPDCSWSTLWVFCNDLV